MEIIAPVKLRPYQEIDSEILYLDFAEKVAENKYQKALCNAVMGYGKTEVMINHVHRLLNDDLCLFTIVAPTLGILTETTRRFISYDVDEVFSYVIFASETIPGVKKTTNESIVKEVDDAERIVIFTTYISYPKLMQYVKPNYVIFDEFHRINSKIEIEDDIHYLGMTATPGFSPFVEIVTRNLRWARESGIVCNYKINIILSDTHREVADVVELILEHSNKLLVYNRSVDEAIELAETLPDICEAVIGKTKYEERREKEERIRLLEQGVLSSVSVYREGTNLPWLDSILYCRKPQTAKNMLQTLGRILRPHQDKTVANVYFFVDTSEHDYWKKMINYIRKYIRVLKENDNFANERFPCYIIHDGSVGEELPQRVIQYVLDK